MKGRIILLIGILLSILSISSVAMTTDHENLSFTKVDTEYLGTGKGINIAIGPTGDIGIGLENNRINVYNSEGDFMTAYTFNLVGSYTFDFAKDGSIVLMPSRSSKMFYFNKEGKLVKTEKYSSSAEHVRIDREASKKKQIEISDRTYLLDNTMMGTSLKIIFENKEEKIVYIQKGFISQELLVQIFLVIVGIFVSIKFYKDFSKRGKVS